MNKVRVFVSGINGFVGQNLQPYLANAFDISCISRNGKAAGLTYTTFLEEKIAYDALVHLAGKANNLKKTSLENDYFVVH